MSGPGIEQAGSDAGRQASFTVGVALEVKLVVFLGEKADAFPTVAQALGVTGWESSQTGQFGDDVALVIQFGWSFG